MSEVLLRTGTPLSQLRKQIGLYPQLTKNIRVKEKRELAECRNLSASYKRIEKSLNGEGRVLVRYSGTEPKIRLLVEAKDGEVLAAAMDELVGAVQVDLG